MLNISSGKRQRAQKVVLYGPEGIGKTTLATTSPRPLFLDLEDGSNQLDVDRIERPATFGGLCEVLRYIRDHAQEVREKYDSIIIDALDSVEKLINQAVMSEKGLKSMEEIAYGGAYRIAYEKFGRFTNLLTEIADASINVICIGHSFVTTTTRPGTFDQYDRFELRLRNSKNTSMAAMVKEWADAVLFMDYAVDIVKDTKTGKTAIQGGKKRVIYADHSASWDAKNRWGLPERVYLDDFKLADHLLGKLSKAAEKRPEKTPQIGQDVKALDTLTEKLKNEPKNAKETPQNENEGNHEIKEAPKTPEEVAKSLTSVTDAQKDAQRRLKASLKDAGLSEAQCLWWLRQVGYIAQGTEFCNLRADVAAYASENTQKMAAAIAEAIKQRKAENGE